MELVPLLVISFLAALVTCLATGLGALPFAFVGSLSERWEGGMEGLAAGMMAAASGYLVYEGLVYDGGALEWVEVAAGLVSGAGFFLLAGKWLDAHEDFDVAGLRKAGGLSALLIVAAMTIHSLPEGVAVGVGFAVAGPELNQGLGFGSAISTAIAFHNIPEGLAISVALRAKGIRVWQCAAWAIVSSVPQPLAAPVATWLAWIFLPLLPAGMGFAAGAMLALVCFEMAPGAKQRLGASGALGAGAGGVLVMVLITLAIAGIGG